TRFYFIEFISWRNYQGGERFANRSPNSNTDHQMNAQPLCSRPEWFPTFAFSLVSPRNLFALAVLVMALGWQHNACAQSDDFNDGNDAGWTKLDLTVAGSPATYTFPDDGTGGKAYRIKANAPTFTDQVGPARAFSYQAPDYTRFSAAVDVINWDLTVDQAFGLLVRASSIGLGTTDGYVMNYNSADGDLQINEIAGESPNTIAEVSVPFDPTR